MRRKGGDGVVVDMMERVIIRRFEMMENTSHCLRTDRKYLEESTILYIPRNKLKQEKYRWIRSSNAFSLYVGSFLQGNKHQDSDSVSTPVPVICGT